MSVENVFGEWYINVVLDCNMDSFSLLCRYFVGVFLYVLFKGKKVFIGKLLFFEKLKIGNKKIIKCIFDCWFFG